MTDHRNPGSAAGPRWPSPVDEQLRETMRDDLPAEVESRLDRRVERFMAERARGREKFPDSPLGFLRHAATRAGESAVGRALLAVASSLLLVAGLALLAAGHRNAFAESFSQVNLAVSLSDAIRRAPSMSCTGMDEASLASRGTLAEAIYRRWTLRRVEREVGDGLRVVFGSGPENVLFELVLDGGTLLPREIRRIVRPGAAPDVAACTWEAPGHGAEGLPPRTEP